MDKISILKATAAQPAQTKQFCLVHGLTDSRIGSGEDYDAIGWAEIVEMAKDPPSKPKAKADAVIGSTFRDYDARDHNAQAEKGQFHMLPIDIDYGNHDIDAVDVALVAVFGDVRRVTYSTFSSKPDDKKWRTFVPVRRAVLGAKFIAVQSAVISLLKDRGVIADKAMSRTGQVSFLPNRGEHYEYRYADKPVLASVDDINGLTARKAQMEADADKQAQQALEAAHSRATLRRKRGGDDAFSFIDWFNERNSIVGMIAHSGWIPMGQGEGYTWWASPYSKSQGRSVRCYAEEGRCVSFTGSDVDEVGAVSPAGRAYYDAFDVFAARQHGGNRDAAKRAVLEMMGRDKARAEFGIAEPCETGEAAGFEVIEATAVEVIEATAVEVPTVGLVKLPPSLKADKPKFTQPPVDIFSDIVAPRFNLGVMPRPIQDFVNINRPAMGAPESLMAMAAVGACMAALDKRISIKPQTSTAWEEHPVLWFMAVGDPSVKKSPVRSLAFKEITRLEKEAHEQAIKQLADYDLQTKLHKRREEAFLKDVMKGAAEISDAPTPPVRPEGSRYTIETATIEALMQAAAKNPGGLVLNSDELSGWFGAMDAYSGNKGGASKDRPLWLQAYNSQRLTVDRVSSGHTPVERFAVGIVGFVQPDALRAALKNLPTDGLLQRFMPFHGEDADLSQDVPTDTCGDFNKLINDIASLEDAQTIKIEPSQEARDTINAVWAEQLFPLLKYKGLPSATRNHIAKLEGALWRLTLLFHVIETTYDRMPLHSQVSVETAQRACDLVTGYLAPSILHLHDGVLGLSGTADVVSAIARWIIAHDVKDFTIRDLTRNVRAFQKLEGDFEKLAVLRKLEDAGWVVSTSFEARYLPRDWEAHPNAAAVFSELASEEKERRGEVVTRLARLRGAK